METNKQSQAQGDSSKFVSLYHQELMEDPEYQRLIGASKEKRQKMLAAKREAGFAEKQFFFLTGLTAASFAIALTCVTLGGGWLFAAGFFAASSAALGGFTSNHNAKLSYLQEKADGAQLDFHFVRENASAYALSHIQADKISKALNGENLSKATEAKWKERVQSQSSASIHLVSH